MQSLDQFKGQCGIRVWLCQIGKNSYYSHLRKQGRIHLVETIPEGIYPSLETSPDHLLINGERSMEIHRILHHLKEPYKEVFTFEDFRGTEFQRNRRDLSKDGKLGLCHFPPEPEKK